MSAPELPMRVGLCPAHPEEFYMPLADGDDLTCPSCPSTMAVYVRVSPGEVVDDR